MTPKKLHIIAGLLTALAVGWPCLSGGLFSGLWGWLGDGGNRSNTFNLLKGGMKYA